MKKKKHLLIWLAAIGVTTFLIFPLEVLDAIKALRKELKREAEELQEEKKT